MQTQVATGERTDRRGTARLRRRGSWAGRLARYQRALIPRVGVWLFCALALLPMLWAVSSSFKGKQELYIAMPSLWIKQPILDNYVYVIEQTKLTLLLTYFRNSLVVTTGTIALTVAVASLAGYAFARARFPGRDLVFYSVVLIMFIPHAGTLMATYELMHAFHLRNSLIGLILLFSARLSVSIFIMRQQYLNLPRDFEDAALIDGCNRWQLFWRIATPMATGAMLVVAIRSFVDVWGEYLMTLTMTDEAKNYTIGVGVTMLGNAVSGATTAPEAFTSYGATAAGYMLAAAPVILVYILLQRWFVRGMMEGLKL